MQYTNSWYIYAKIKWSYKKLYFVVRITKKMFSANIGLTQKFFGPKTKILYRVKMLVKRMRHSVCVKQLPMMTWLSNPLTTGDDGRFVILLSHE